MPGIEHGDHRCGRIALSNDHGGGSVFGALCSRTGPIEFVDWFGRGGALRGPCVRAVELRRYTIAIAMAGTGTRGRSTVKTHPVSGRLWA